MTRDEHSPEARGSEPISAVEDGPTGERVYDAFVVRVWWEVGNPRLLRVELEHAQSGDVVSARGVDVAWIGTRIAEILAGLPRSEVDRRR